MAQAQGDGAPANCLKADEMHAERQFEDLLHMLEKAVEDEEWTTDTEKAHVLWRMSRAYFDWASEKASDKTHKEKFLREGLDAAEKSLAADDKSAFTHKWVAICLSALSDFVSTKEKIQNSVRVKEHAEKAIELKPDDASTWHLFGRWHYAVASVSWIEKKIASTLFATPPDSTYQQALEAFEKAHNHRANFIQNALWAGNTCLRIKDKDGARKWFDLALGMNAVSESEKGFQEEAKKAAAKL